MNKPGNFRKLYDSTSKRNYWILGYFGGGAVNIVDAMELAKEFSQLNNIPLNTVVVDEVLHSRRYKHFKFMFSTVENQQQDPESETYENVYQMLTD